MPVAYVESAGRAGDEVTGGALVLSAFGGVTAVPSDAARGAIASDESVLDALALAAALGVLECNNDDVGAGAGELSPAFSESQVAHRAALPGFSWPHNEQRHFDVSSIANCSTAPPWQYTAVGGLLDLF